MDVEEIIKLEPSNMVRILVYFWLAMATVLENISAQWSLVRIKEYAYLSYYLGDK
jgi:hypothetical protein